MATTSSSQIPPAASRSVSAPHAQFSVSSSTNGKLPETAYFHENELLVTSTATRDGPSAAYRPSYSGLPPRRTEDNPRSFSARAKNNPQLARDFESLDRFTPPTDDRRNANRSTNAKYPYLDTESASSSAPNTLRNTQQSLENTNSSSHSQSSIHVSPLARSNSQRSRGDAYRQPGWTKQRSPLTKLKVTLDSISKEEKRARVEEAEMRLMEAQARRRAELLDSNPQLSSTVGEVGSRDRRNEILSREDVSLPQRSYTLREESHRQAVEPRDHKYTVEPAGNAPRNQQTLLPSALPKSPPHSAVDLQNIPVEEPHTTSRNIQASRQEPTLFLHTGPQRRFSLSRSGSVGRSNSQKLQKPMPKELSARLAASQAPPTNNQASGGIQNQVEENAVGLGLSHVDGQSQDDTSARKENGKTKTKQATVSFAVPPPTPPPLSEWKNAVVCRLQATDFDLRDSHVDKAWWEAGGSRRRRRAQKIEQEDILPRGKLKKNARFQPPLYLKCGPLLRFTGIKTEKIDTRSGPIEREIWRGSIMIVTKDSASSYETPPVLRLFSQPMDLLPPPPAVIESTGDGLAPEYVDPIAGVAKMGRNGKLLFVKPVDHIEEELDLSFVETEEGLYELSPSPLDYGPNSQVSQPPDARLQAEDGESVGKYKEVEGIRLYADPARDVTFWRFSIEIELCDTQQRLAYRINRGSAVGFWVPAKGQSMNVMFYSGNGFAASVDTNKCSGPDPMWRDVLNVHQTQPFHVMIGGGGQIYSEAVSFETTHFQEWLDMRNRYEQFEHPLNLDIKAELESFYLEHYCKWFSQGLFSMANSQIPMVNMWDGNDILTGFGSYSEEFMRSPVFSGLGNIAFKYYLLFQHQTVVEETDVDEPSWLLGLGPGPYIQQRSRNIFMKLGRKMALLAIDCRTERTRDSIIGDDTYDHIWDRCYQEIQRGETKHLLVVLAEPIASPRAAWLQNVLTSKALEPVRALGRAGLFGGFGDRDDGIGHPDDQWTAKIHKEERRWLVEDLQELAAEKSVRITILGGGAHLAAVGQFYSNPKLQISRDKDYRYMPNLISSAIVNQPISEMASNLLNRGSRTHIFDLNTVEDLRPIFTQDVDGKPRSNKRLMPRRNWCSIREYKPGSTPPRTPSETSIQASPPPSRSGSLIRRLSLSRGDKASFPLARRSSQRGPPPSRWPSLRRGDSKRRMSFDTLQRSNTQTSLNPPRPSTGVNHSAQALGTGDNDQIPRPGDFVRRRTDLSEKELKAAAKDGQDLHHFINMEHGLDITLNCEVNPKDPAGITTPYRVLVPALWFEGYFEPSVPLAKKRWWRLGRQDISGPPAADSPAPDRAAAVATGPTSAQQVEIQEDPEKVGYYAPQPDKAPSHVPPSMLHAEGEVQSTEAMRSSGYDGVEAYRSRKKFLGIF
ncbi:hypothetical protein VTO42DRAFT_2259 [Malbranchea cinnamomea]